VRTSEEIRAELAAAIERRGELWHDLGEGADATKTAEVARLSSKIENLWAEARAVEVQRRFGPPALIQARARTEERLEREARPKAA
jgi:hypothetical protein